MFFLIFVNCDFNIKIALKFKKIIKREILRGALKLYKEKTIMKQTLLIPMVPRVMGDTRLELLDKLLLSYVYNWENRGQICYSKNDFFANLFGVTPDAISFSVRKLETLKLVEITNVPGGRSIKSKEFIQSAQLQNEIDIFEI